MTMHERDSWHLHEGLNARTKLLNNGLFTLNNLLEVDVQPERCQFGVVAERLCGYAPTVQACTASLRRFNDHYLQAIFGSVLSSPVAAGSAANDNQVGIHASMALNVSTG